MRKLVIAGTFLVLKVLECKKRKICHSVDGGQRRTGRHIDTKIIKHKSILLAALALVATLSSAHAAALAWSGAQLNVDAKQTTLPVVPDSVGWRNANSAKTYDVDGDHIIGTDGYYHRRNNTVGVRPGYITAFTNISGGENNFGYADDPTDPTGMDDFRTSFWEYNNTSRAQNLYLFSFTVGDLGGDKLGVAIQYDTYLTATFTFNLRQTIGGSGMVISSSLTNANDGYDWAFFTIEGAAIGDTFIVSSADVGASNTIQWHQWGGVAWDTVAIPEPSAALIGSLGLLALLRRRR